MDKYICIHGHFYQPPRENPWLESIELQDSAWPYHDWNERITVECYAPNATARIMNPEGKIALITSNYSKMSFNFGPTLLAWLHDKMPEIHEAIVAADRLSRDRFAGHGSALAQVYNHMILPLANDRDRYTQTLWGIRDFEFRFGRPPEGMWLAETAADMPTLKTLADLGIKFTILSPFQGSKARELGKRHWRDVNGGQIDPKRPYLIRLPNHKRIVAFFYDSPVSQAVAFEKLLTSGERFAQRLVGAFDQRPCDQLVHIATDGESYGHHHRYGEMALAYALDYLERNQLAKLTNYGEYLEKHPVTHEAQIHEKSAWSCSHGLGRWMADCGCNSGGHSDWNQSWRAPLRQALDWLRDEVAPLYEQAGSTLFRDPWEARNEYISVILDRSAENRNRFFTHQANHDLNDAEKVMALKLLELQRHAMLMHTSCGWFFDELSGIESVQVVQYAARVLQLARETLNRDLEQGFLDRYQQARSNIVVNGDGRNIYQRFVKPAMIDWHKAAAHYAITSVFQEYSGNTRIFSFSVEDESRQLFSSGKTKLAIGQAKFISQITQESDQLAYAILYLGEHNLTGSVRKFDSPQKYDDMLNDLKQAYDAAEFPEVIRRMDRHFGHASYSLKSLFKDDQRRIVNEILASTREDLDSRFRLITDRYSPLMKFLEGAGVPPPPGLAMVSDLVLHSDIRTQLEADPVDFERLANLIGEAQSRDTRVLDPDISFVVKNRMEEMMTSLVENPEDLDKMRMLEQLAVLVMPLPLGLNLWKVQNTYWEMTQNLVPQRTERAASGDENARNWLRQFLSVGDHLGFAVKPLEEPANALPVAA